MENHGKMTIKDHNSGITCDLDYKAYSIFSSAEVCENPIPASVVELVVWSTSLFL
jgi:hypothetical protein